MLVYRGVLFFNAIYVHNCITVTYRVAGKVLGICSHCLPSSHSAAQKPFFFWLTYSSSRHPAIQILRHPKFRLLVFSGGAKQGGLVTCYVQLRSGLGLGLGRGSRRLLCCSFSWVDMCALLRSVLSDDRRVLISSTRWLMYVYRSSVPSTFTDYSVIIL